MLGNDVALFPAIHHDIHKVRRAAVSPFFSTSAVNRFHPVVQQTIDRLCKRIEQNIKQKEPVPLFFAFRCVTVDIITEYLFGKQLDLVDRNDWGRSFYGAWRGLWEMSPIIRQWPWIMPLFRAAPRWLLAATNPKALEVVDMEATCDEWTVELLASDPEEVKKQKYPIVLWEVYQSGQLPAFDMSIQRMSLLGSNTLAAGFETVGTTLSHLIYGVLADLAIHKRLLEELGEAIPDPNNIPSHTVLEKLPYLNAVVKEGVR
jgi:cytochrome P450